MKDGKERKGRKGNTKYLLTLSSAIVLLMVAIMGPQVLFRIQDDYRMGTTWQGQREGLDMEALNSSYGSLRDRMEAFAYGLEQGEKYYVTGTDYKISRECYTLIEEIFSREEFFYVQGLGNYWPLNMTEMIKELGYGVEEWKKYIIYEDSFEDGMSSVSFMAWYIELKTEDNYRIKLLADAESGTLYYIQCTNENDIGELTEDWYPFYSVIDPYFEMVVFWNYYYEADNWREEDYYNLQKQYEMINTNVAVMDDGIVAVSADPDALDLEYDMSYDSKYLTWEFGLSPFDGKNEGVTLYMGIEQIGDLIPELQ